MDRPRERKPSEPEGLDPESDAQVVLVAQIVRESLDAYAAREHVDQILRAALAAAALEGIPREPRALDAFVSAHLVPAARDRLGPDAAEAILHRLAPLVAAMERLVHERAQRDVPTMPAPAGSGEDHEGNAFATVLLAGSPQDARRLSMRVLMPVQRVIDAHALIDAVVGCGGVPAMIVVDCRAPSAVLHGALRAVDPVLLDGSVVALWGASPADERAWRARFAGAVVLRTDVAADVEDIAVLVRLGPA